MMKMNQLVVFNWQQNNAGVLFRNPITSTVLIIVRGYIEDQVFIYVCIPNLDHINSYQVAILAASDVYT
jgi:hypothetical protein